MCQAGVASLYIVNKKQPQTSKKNEEEVGMAIIKSTKTRVVVMEN